MPALALVFARRGLFGEVAQTREHGGSVRATTDELGEFAFDELATGTWQIYVFAQGYERWSDEVEIVDGVVESVEVFLDPR